MGTYTQDIKNYIFIVGARDEDFLKLKPEP